jgi:hypothetical protein
LRPKQQQPPPWPLPLSTLPYVFFILANNTNLQDPPFSLEEAGSGKRLATHLEKVSLKYSSFSPSAGSYQRIVTFISAHTDNMTLHEISDMCFSNTDIMISCRPSPPSLRDKKAATFIASESRACCCCSSFSFSPLLLQHLKSCQLVISASTSTSTPFCLSTNAGINPHGLIVVVVVVCAPRKQQRLCFRMPTQNPSLVT